METKHTPAPWKIRGNEIGKVIESDDQSHGMLSLIATVDVYDMPEQAEANKRLIASAPSLLEALDGLMELESRGRIMPIGEEWDKARAAIAAAKGDL